MRKRINHFFVHRRAARASSALSEQAGGRLTKIEFRRHKSILLALIELIRMSHTTPNTLPALTLNQPALIIEVNPFVDSKLPALHFGNNVFYRFTMSDGSEVDYICETAVDLFHLKIRLSAASIEYSRPCRIGSHTVTTNEDLEEEAVTMSPDEVREEHVENRARKYLVQHRRNRLQRIKDNAREVKKAQRKEALAAKAAAAGQM